MLTSSDKAQLNGQLDEIQVLLDRVRADINDDTRLRLSGAIAAVMELIAKAGGLGVALGEELGEG